MLKWRCRPSHGVAFAALAVWASGCALFQPARAAECPGEDARVTQPAAPEVVVERVEASECAVPEDVARADDASAKRAPAGTLSVSWGNDPQKLTLEARGARLGRVLEEISRRTDQMVVGVGAHSDTRIWASVRQPRPWRVLVEQLATAAGARAVDEGDAVIVMDEATWRARALARSTPAPILTVALPAEHPAELARVLTRLGSSCEGSVIWRAGEPGLIARDRAGHVAHVERLAAWVTGQGEAQTLELEERRARPRERQPVTCEESGAASDDTLGGAIVEAAVSARREAIVGCGGAREARAVLTSRATPEALAKALGLASASGGDVWATPEALSSRGVDIGPRLNDGPVIARIASASPERDAAWIEAVFPELRVSAYAPGGWVVVGGDRALIATARALLGAAGET